MDQRINSIRATLADLTGAGLRLRRSETARIEGMRTAGATTAALVITSKVFAVWLAFACLLSPVPSFADQEVVRLATTTSTENSGLLNVLLPTFTHASGINVQVIAVGTGKALELGRRGDVDLVLVHAREQEDEFVRQGYGIDRRDVMYNDFVVLGPPDDPAHVKGAHDAQEAFSRIAGATGARFVSRGDNSGTEIKEQAIWKAAHTKPVGAQYLAAGQGMGEVLLMTSELGAYTLADRGTWIAMRNKLRLQIVLEKDPLLSNPYGVIRVRPREGLHVSQALSLENWLVSPEGQNAIASYRIDNEQLFFPDAHP